MARTKHTAFVKAGPSGPASKYDLRIYKLLDTDFRKSFNKEFMNDFVQFLVFAAVLDAVHCANKYERDIGKWLLCCIKKLHQKHGAFAKQALQSYFTTKMFGFKATLYKGHGGETLWAQSKDRREMWAKKIEQARHA